MKSSRTAPESRHTGDKPRRIETQIHRRKKAKAVYPMQAEWEQEARSGPPSLRMPPEKMGRKKPSQP